jgi:hypothetical protein
LLDALPMATKCSVGEVRAGWVEAGELVESGLELVFSERGIHEFDTVVVWQPRDVVEERWCGPAADFLMDLEGSYAAEFPGVQYKCWGNGSIAFESFGEKGDCLWGAPWVVPCVGSGCVYEGGYEVGRPGALLEMFAVRAVG